MFWLLLCIGLVSAYTCPDQGCINALSYEMSQNPQCSPGQLFPLTLAAAFTTLDYEVAACNFTTSYMSTSSVLTCDNAKPYCPCYGAVTNITSLQLTALQQRQSLVQLCQSCPFRQSIWANPSCYNPAVSFNANLQCDAYYAYEEGCTSALANCTQTPHIALYAQLQSLGFVYGTTLLISPNVVNATSISLTYINSQAALNATAVLNSLSFQCLQNVQTFTLGVYN